MSKYREYLQSDEWIEKRDRILKRDKYQCQKCHAPARDVHHLTYARVRRERDEDLISVCRNCHQFEHQRMTIDEAVRHEVVRRRGTQAEMAVRRLFR
jgi:5-methylcytosine-specific restriction endonuclease McrA